MDFKGGGKKKLPGDLTTEPKEKPSFFPQQVFQSVAIF